MHSAFSRCKDPLKYCIFCCTSQPNFLTLSRESTYLSCNTCFLFNILIILLYQKNHCYVKTNLCKNDIKSLTGYFQKGSNILVMVGSSLCQEKSQKTKRKEVTSSMRGYKHNDMNYSWCFLIRKAETGWFYSCVFMNFCCYTTEVLLFNPLDFFLLILKTEKVDLYSGNICLFVPLAMERSSRGVGVVDSSIFERKHYIYIY